MLLKRVIKILKYLLFSCVLLFTVILAGINLPFSQQIISEKANGLLRNRNLPVSVGDVTLLLNGRVGLKKIKILNNRDTVVFAEKIEASVRLMPLLMRKVKVNSLSVQDAVVNISADSITGIPDLVTLFTSPEKQPESVEKTGKAWEINVKTVSIKNVRFKYIDSYHGIITDQTVGSLNIGFDEFSLVRKKIISSYVDISGVMGALSLSSSRCLEEDSGLPPPAWVFGTRKSVLRDIIFTIEQPDNNRLMKFSLRGGEISYAAFSLAARALSFDGIKLEEPVATIYSSPSGRDMQHGSGNLSQIEFPGNWDISGKKASIDNGSFHSFFRTDTLELIREFGPLQVKSFNTIINDIRLNRNQSGFVMSNISAGFENGFRLDNSELSLTSGSSLKSVLTAELKTASGKINLDIEAEKDLTAILNSWNSVTFSLVIKETVISAGDILLLFPGIVKKPLSNGINNLSLTINCEAGGTSDLLNIKNLSLKTSSGISFSSSGMLAGITNPQSGICSLDFALGPLSRSHLKELIVQKGLSSELPEFEPLTVTGTIADSLLAPDFRLTLESITGIIDAEGSADFSDKSYSLNMAYKVREAGLLSGIGELGQVSGRIEMEGKNFNPDIMVLDALVYLDSAEYRGYSYHDIRIVLDGEYSLYNFALNSSDPNFFSEMKGNFSLKDSSFTGEVSGLYSIDAGRLNLLGDLTLSGSLKGEVEHSRAGLNASISFGNLVLENTFKREELERMALTFHTDDYSIKGGIESDVINGEFYSAGSISTITKVFREGRFRFATILDSAEGKRIPYISALPSTKIRIESIYDPIIGLVLNDSIFSYRLVSLDIFKDSLGIATGDISVDRFSAGVTKGYGGKIHIESLPERSVIRMSADSLKYKNFALNEVLSDIYTVGDSAIYSLKANDNYGRLIYDLNGIALKKGEQVMLHSIKSQWIINGFKWDVFAGDYILVNTSNGDISANLHWKDENSSIDIYGSKPGEIKLELSKVGMKMLLLPGMEAFGYDGELTGKIEYKGNKNDEVGIQMDINQVKMGETLLGNLRIEGSYKSDTSGTKETDLQVVMNKESKINFSMLFGKEKDQKRIFADFNNIRLHSLESFVGNYVNGISGDVSGVLSLTFPGSKPILNGEVRILNTGLRVVPLNALFYINDDVLKIENSKLVFNQFTVLDSLRKRLRINGNIDMTNPSRFLADLQVTSDLLQVMNTTSKDNQGFNGSVFINSNLKITGPVKTPAISGRVVLAEGTVINYRYTEDLNVSETQKTVIFASLTEEQDTINKTKVAINTLAKSPDVEATVEINPASLFNFEISRGFDISASITGGGFLTYSLLQNSDIDLSGTYEIQQGSSQLKIPGWPRKDFIITPGTTINWDGKIDDPELKMETTSKVRGSYVNPVDNQNREVNFLVFMKLSGRLSELEILFDVKSEDQYLTTYFNTLSTDERMRQAINLLIFERVELPGQKSSSDYLSQQISQFAEYQLNQATKSATKKLDLDVSVGLDTYTRSTTSGEQTTTSLSYQVKKDMFNERGSVLLSGHSNYGGTTSQQANAVIENFIFEYAVDSSRTKFLKVYRQQNYEDLLEGEVIKSGIGFIYRKSYDRISDIWRRKKKKE